VAIYNSGAVAKETATSEVRGTGFVPAPVEATETLQMRYLSEHFAYIRDLIGKELRYPRQAVRMGWSGRVTVSFLVLVDGSVADPQVNHTSGVPLLDRNALETVRRAAPFPKPPISARLVMPVDYILE
jgi:protein TonB